MLGPSRIVSLDPSSPDDILSPSASDSVRTLPHAAVVVPPAHAAVVIPSAHSSNEDASTSSAVSAPSAVYASTPVQSTDYLAAATPSVPFIIHPFAIDLQFPLRRLRLILWPELLQKSGHEPAFISAFMSGHRDGFDILFQGSEIPPFTKNHSSASDHPDVVEKALRSELNKGFLAGPFPSPPFSPFRVSPIGVVLKKWSSPPQFRLIHDLSFPRYGPSLNAGIDRDQIGFKMARFDEVVQFVASHDGPVYLYKFDVEDAFKQLGVLPSFWPQLGLFWAGFYYYFMYLPFGMASSSYLFEEFYARPFLQILRYLIDPEFSLSYVDDFCGGATELSRADDDVARIKELAAILGVPLHPDKWHHPSPCMTFLGLEIDTLARVVRIPWARRELLISVLNTWLARSSCTRFELEQLLGLIGFFARAIPSGRFFFWRIRFLAYSVTRRHHHISLNGHFHDDVRWWLSAININDGIHLIRDQEPSSPCSFTLASDASGSIGCGGICGTSWFSLLWSDARIPVSVASAHDIGIKELFAVLISTWSFGHFWSRQRIVFSCDNLGVVQSFQKGYGSSLTINQLLRSLYYASLHFQIDLSLTHIPGKHNTLADALSRAQFRLFQQLCPQAETTPVSIPPQAFHLH